MKKRLIGSLLFGALMVSSSSVFVSCADYDDDINANKAEIVAAQNEIAKLSSSLSALETELKTTKTNLESQLSALESSFKTQIADAEGRLNTAIAAKADQTTVDNLIKEVNDLKAAYEANKAAVQAKLDAIDKDIAALQALIATKADQAALDAAIQTLTAAINGKVDKETYNEAVARISALETQLASLKDLINTLQTEKAALTEVQNKIDLVNKDIEALKEALNGKVSQEAFNSLKATVDGLQTTLANVQAAFQAALDKKADQATVDALKADVQAKIDELNNQLKNYVTTDTFNAAVSRLESLITTLQNSKADKTEVTALQATLVAVQATVADLQNNKADKEAVNAALESLRKEVEALVASKADKTDIVRLENLIEKLQALVDTKASQADVDAKEAALQALIAALEANKADRTELEAAKKDLSDALAAAVSSINNEIAAKYAELSGRIDKVVEDLDDMRQDIVGILADLAAATGEIERVESKFNQLIKDLQDADVALDGKIAKLEGVVNGHIEAYEIAKKALDQQVAALELFQKNMEETVIPGLKKDLENASAELKKKIEDEETARKAAITEVMTEISGVKSDIATKYAELKKLIADGDKANADAIDALEKRVKDLEDKFATIDKKIADAISANVENIMVYVSKVLKSISLVPQLYIGGIEAIEFSSLTYDPLQPGTSGLGTTQLHARLKANEKTIRVDNGTAEAYYTLSPANVKRETIDEDKIVYKSAIAETRATPYYGTETPVAFAGIAEWGVKGQPGLIKVNLKKTITGSLNLGGNQNGEEVYIVNLNVPRKASEVAGVKVDEKDAVITSENHMLVENEFTPKIAYLPWGTSLQTMRWGGLNGDQNLTNYRYHHFTDSVTMWRQKVDFDAANEQYHMVYKEVVYNQTLDVRAMVTGCFHEEGTPKDEADHAGIQAEHAKSYEMSKDKLKTYGLTFRFAIPTTEYKMDVDHSTDQQQFAKIDAKTGILSSKLPLGRTDNRAVVGKEPIVRIMLIDTVRGKLVDERYMKIKWVELKKQPVTLAPYDVETTLVPCDLNKSKALTWKHVIEEIYANVVPEGMSQKTFEQVYLSKEKPVTFSPVKRYWKYSYTLPYANQSGTTATQLSLLSPAIAENGPEIDLTKNEQGDAVIAKWELNPEQIANIYPFQQKTFVSTLTFHSILPTEYPDLNMDWIWTVKLPTLPEINGYYDDYWFTQYSVVDVMAVQYGTAQYNNIKNGTIVPGKDYGIDAPAVGMQLYDKANNAVEPGTDYCVFYNAITNAFTYEQKNNLPQFIVKKLGWACSTWDMQFTWPGVDAIEGQLTWNDSKKQWNNGSAKNFFHLKSQGNNKTNPNIKDNKVWTDNIAARTYTQMNGYRPASNTNSPSLNKINWKTAGAYKLETAEKNPRQALQLEWWGMMELKNGVMTGNFDQTDGNHEAWDNITKDGRKPYNYAMLYADHHNAANQALLNPIVPKGIGVEPDRTHDKKVHMGVWGTLNDWNIVPVKDYDFCLVEPLAINADLGGAFEEGYVSGTVVRSDDAFKMTDFRGYEVAMAAPEANATEWTKYRQNLYKYYEVQEPVWDLKNVRYGMKPDGGSVKIDDNLTYAQAMTAGQISLQTNGNVVLSIDDPVFNGVKYLRFKNNQGSNVELPFWVYIPVTAEYGFGKVSMQSKVRVYPKGKVPADVIITPYPGPLD